MERHLELLAETKAAIAMVYAAFGRPGDYGYYSPEGKALKSLYDLNNEIVDALASPAPATGWADDFVQQVDALKAKTA